MDANNPLLAVAKQRNGDVLIFHLKYRSVSSKSGSFPSFFSRGAGGSVEVCKLIKTITLSSYDHEENERIKSLTTFGGKWKAFRDG
jgi:hypothetical protein